MTKKSKKFKITRKLAAISLIALIVIVGGVFTYKHYHLDRKDVPVAVAPEGKPQTNSIKHTAGASSSAAQGGASDSQGATTPTTQSTSSSDWTTSPSGLITLQQPIANARLSSGDTVRGLAQVDTVQYRLVDNKVGVLAQGSLSVVDGKFSGVLGFKVQGTAGQLDVFSYDSQYQELSEIQLPVTFSP